VITPPKISDYLPTAIRKAVFNAGIKHPATLYPVAIGAASGVVGGLFSLPALYIAALIGILFGFSWTISQIFFFHEKISARYDRQLNEKQKRYEHQVRRSLEKDLNECRRIEEFGTYATHGTEQLKAIEEKLLNVKELLKLKLRGEELTFGRFLGAAEQVSLSVLDNLKELAGILKSAGSIRTDYIRDRFDALSDQEQQNEEIVKQETALKKRLFLRDEQLKKVTALLTKNEEAMTEMEKISAAVAKWQTNGRFADTNFESAIGRLQELAAQAHEFND